MTEPPQLGSTSGAPGAVASAGPRGASRPRLTLVTLGGWALASADPEGAPTPVFGPSKPLALLAYLACAPGRTAGREHLVDLLWADLEPDAAHHAFRQTLWYIRQRIGTDGLASDAGHVSLTADVEIDRDSFDAAVAQQDHERAVTLYTGDFLPGFAAPGGAEFEQWADLERHRLRSFFQNAAETLARRRLAEGRTREAVAVARRVRDSDPEGEVGWRLLLEAMLAAGDRVGAAVEADALGARLRAEERQPEPATRALLARTVEAPAGMGSGDARHGAAALVAELIGREREFRTALEAWDKARRGGGRHVHVSGAAGLGKTRLLADLSTRLRAGGARVVSVRANPGQRGVPCAAASDLAAALAALPGAAAIPPATAGTLVALNPALSSRYPATPMLRSADPDVLRHRGIALTELLAAVCDEAPVALLVDDVHWMDAESRQLLVALAASVEHCHGLLVTAGRPTRDAAPEGPRTTRVTLLPLTPMQVGALVASLGKVPAEPWSANFAMRLHAVCGGSPLLLLETLQFAMETGAVRLAPGDAAMDSATGDGWACDVPDSLDALLAEGSALRRRVEALDRDARWLLLVLAVAGTPLDGDRLRRLAPRVAGAVEDDLQVLEQRGIAARVGEAWVPAHDAIADVAIETAAPDAVRGAHNAIAHLLLADAGTDPTSVQVAGGHFAAASDDAAHHAAFRRWIALAKARPGSRGNAHGLALEFLGGRGKAGDAGRLVRQLPVWLRLGLRRRDVAAAAVAVVVLLSLALRSLWWSSPEPDLVLFAQFRNADGSLRTVEVPLWTRDFERGAPILLAQARPAGKAMDSVVLGQWTQRQPRGTAWAEVRTASDSGGQDIFLVDQSRTRRLTAYRGDDEVGSWSPDGRTLAVVTDRWARSNRSNVAILDPATGAMRQLTRSDERDRMARWSPDGTRIAFLRDALSTQLICTVDVSGEGERCAPAFARDNTILRWLDVEHLAVASPDSAGKGVTWVADASGATQRPLVSGVLSPTGEPAEWAVCRCATSEREPSTWRVISLRDPRLQRRVAGGDSATGLALVAASVGGARYLDTLRVEAVGRGVARDTRFQLRVEGRDQHGEPVSPRQVRWRSLTPDIAGVTPDGVLIPRSEGSARVEASAGGWRADTAVVPIVAPRLATTVREERWESLDLSFWTPFGEPRPYLLRGPGGVAGLMQNGDSSNTSGVHTSRALDGSAGLGVEVRLSTVVTARLWQLTSVQLVGGIDSVTLARWDHHTGAPPTATAGAYTLCVAVFSSVYQGSIQAGAMSAVRGGLRADFPTDGRWWTVRLQTFPDGRCGVAVNGRVVSIVSESPRDPRAFLFLHGYSHRTRFLFGPLEIWHGVRRDIDWEGAGAASPRSARQANRRNE